MTQTLQLIELFASIQGETSFSGLPTAFVRLAKCNLRCSWCDTPYSFGRGKPWLISSIVEEIQRMQCQHVCVTGGEPLLQPSVHELMRILCDSGYIVSLETGGSLPIQDVDPRVCIILDIKCPGSAMAHKNHWENLAMLRAHDEVKWVLAHREDFEYAKKICDQYGLFKRPHPPLFSPVHGVLHPQELVKWILEEGLRVRLNLQIHKYIWSPTERGV